ncbi:DUF167 domain-containing protein [Breznakiella homolactica]|uniref:UPF0235 protein JFL75_16955 n=1 Tax=Breznakiella homolactica TaxID=2798577 RepID=A0A7T8BA42_9SPIR|nr:DUF167 domain-containing protein [Breznakiella homolactica]QQO08600.1 DUF167 domain-containing protein [Breznakiella homolactica]
MTGCLRESGESVFLDIKVVPGSSKSCVAGIQENRLRIKIAAAPEDGKANGELRNFLAKMLGIPKKDITIRSGEKSRLKTLELPGEHGEKLRTFLAGLSGTTAV